VNNNIQALVFKYDPSEDYKPRYEKYEVPYREGMNILEVLKFIDENYMPLAFRYSCRIKICGSCAIMVNDRPVLACKEKAQMNMTIEPLPPFPVIRDLVVDFDNYQERRVKIRPFVERGHEPEKLPRSLSYDVVNKYRDCEICTRCLICDAACPVFKELPHQFSGPSLMLELARFIRDPQDNGNRIGIAISEGLFKCDLCGKCTEVCPVGIRVHEIIGELQGLANDIQSNA